MRLRISLPLRVRRARRGKKTPSAAPQAAAGHSVVAKPADGKAEPGWAGLLAAYESKPRQDGDGQEGDPGSARPVPPEQVAPEPEPVFEEAPLALVPEPAGRGAGVQNLSAALLDASLIALAAVLATRMLENDG